MNIYAIEPIGTVLSGNTYPGRGIIAGLTPDGKNAVSAYFIMGRSANSRNRVFTLKDGALFTEPFDASKVQDPSLIIYAAVRSFGDKLVVTNGDQTDTVYLGYADGKDFRTSLATRCFEPDGPNFTPRISAELTFGSAFTYSMNILKSADAEGTACNRYTYDYAPIAGTGHFIHTYVCDGNPIPTFQGEPERVQTRDDIDAFTGEIWDALDENNRISLYVRYTSLADGSVTDRLINKNIK